MPTNYMEHVAAATQREQDDPKQVPNSAGGFSFVVDDWSRLERFLILGSEGGSYYATERKLTRESAQALDRCIAADPVRTATIISEVSKSGRAPKNDPAIFALAVMASHKNDTARKLALAILPDVCRIGTHLFQFVDQVQQARGWGGGLKRGVARWYDRSPDDIAYQVAKYQQRNGMSHRDVLRLCHARVSDSTTQAVLGWASTGVWPSGMRPVKRKTVQRPDRVVTYATPTTVMPRVLQGFTKLREITFESARLSEIAKVVKDYGLTWEMVPSEHLASPVVWDALLETMPMTAMVRNLGRMTANGLLAPGSDAARVVRERLRDGERIRKARLHPMSVLIALRTYQQGHGDKGKLAWQPVAPIVDALDDGFYLAFGSIVPSGKRMMLALDVSGSMSSGQVAGGPLSPREASAAMAMVTARTEPDYDLVAFTAAAGGYGGQWGGGSPGLSPIPITAKTSLPDAIKAVSSMPMGGTDCALPMLHATKLKQRVDCFVVYTDSETWHGAVHPHRALVDYRRAMNVPAKLVVCGMVANQFTIADPGDAGMMDVVGFDAAAPAVIADFAKG